MKFKKILQKMGESFGFRCSASKMTNGSFGIRNYLVSLDKDGQYLSINISSHQPRVDGPDLFRKQLYKLLNANEGLSSH